ncbi:hypothetical protein JOM56_011870 [Amanita muscaria]
MDPFYNPTRTIISSFVTAILFGLYLAGFVHCVRWLLFEDEGWRARKKVNWTLVIATLLIFFFATVWFSMAVVGILQGPVYIRLGSPVPANTWVEIILTSSACYWSVLIIIDCVQIHRCWIVFSKSWIIICFPLALWCYCLICAITTFYCDLGAVTVVIWQSSRGLAHAMCLGPYPNVMRLGFYICNIVVSIYTTCALVYQIWHAAKNNRVGTNRLYRICRILTESGILYTLSSIINLAWWIGYQIIESLASERQQPFMKQYLFLIQLRNEIVGPLGIFLPGIAFNLTTIRVYEQRAMGEDTWVDSSDDNEAPMPSELFNNPDTSKAEKELTDIQEGHGKMDERKRIETGGTENEEII